jgi:hypothetical protein
MVDYLTFFFLWPEIASTEPRKEPDLTVYLLNSDMDLCLDENVGFDDTENSMDNDDGDDEVQRKLEVSGVSWD